ncbi:MAG: T9SS type A sorting domain-containing protein [Bacteroidales bacterium]|nr:T9SS type A sorting domain-containing protein [Bacteroidales bacterium]
MRKINKTILRTLGLSGLFFFFHLGFSIAQSDGSTIFLCVKPTEDSLRINHKISGQALFLPGSVPFAGLKISFSGVGEAVVAENGTYSMDVPRHWTGTATPYLCEGGGYLFEPASISYVDVVFDKTNQNYMGEATTIHTISGTFTDINSGEPLANTQITFNLSGGDETGQIIVTTNEIGEYSFERLPCWSNTLDPYLSGLYYFEPRIRSYDHITSDQLNQNFEVIYYNYPQPPGWETINTGSFSFIAVDINSDPDICEASLNIGDLIGVFYNDENGISKCGGFGRWQDENNVFISAQGDDNTTANKDGFANFETYTWKIFSYADQISYPANVDMSIGNNYWSSFGLSKVSALDGFYEHSLQIFAGWSGISSYILPDIYPAFIDDIMEPIIDDLVIIQTLDKMYYPEAGVNNLLFWNYNKGYKIKVNNDVELPMDGCPEANRTINLTATWNLIPVLSKCDVLVEDLFFPITNKLILVKEIGGTGIYWPQMEINTLGVLQSGKAYLAAVSGNASITFAPCENAKSKLISETLKEPDFSPWEIPVKTGSSHTLLFKSEAFSDIRKGDFLGAFTRDGYCAGITEIKERETNIGLTIFGDDISTNETDGFIADEEIIFKIYKSETNEELIAFATFDCNYYPDHAAFTDNGVSVINKMEVNPSGLISPTGQLKCFPNPSSGIVKFQTDSDETFVLTIQNMNGQTLFETEITENGQLDLSFFEHGIYILKLESEEQILISKLILK